MPSLLYKLWLSSLSICHFRDIASVGRFGFKVNSESAVSGSGSQSFQRYLRIYFKIFLSMESDYGLPLHLK